MNTSWSNPEAPMLDPDWDLIDHEASIDLTALKCDKPTPEELCIQKNIQEKIMKALEVLNHKQHQVVSLHHGLNETNPHSFNEIAKIMNIPRDRANHIYVKAMRLLSHPSTLESLKGCL